MPTLVLADGGDHRLDGLEHEAGTVLDRCRRSRRCADSLRPDELLQQVAVGPVQLHAVETGRERVPGGVRVFGDRVARSASDHRGGHRERLHALGVGVHLAARGNRRGADDAGARRQVQRVPDSAGVHQLHEHPGAERPHGIGHQLPAGDLLGRKQAGNARVAETVWRGRGALRDDQPGRGALRVVLRHQRVRDVARGAAASHRRHHEAVLQAQRSERSL